MPGPDRVQVTKVERLDTGGDPADDFEGLASSIPIDAQEDAIESAGHYFQDATFRDENVYIDRDGDDLRFRDVNNTTPVTLSSLLGGGGLTEATHETLDTLAHDIVEDSFDEATYTGPRLTNLTQYTDVTKTTKIREYQFTYTTGRVTQAVSIQYDGAGVETYRITETFTYSGFRVASISRVRTP